MIRYGILHTFLLITVLALASCSGYDPPFGELGGTRWNATNIASGVLIDIGFGAPGTYDVSMSYYLDPVPYNERGSSIDTVGNFQFSMKGEYTPRALKTDSGDMVYGYEWEATLVKSDGSVQDGFFKYDYETMFFQMDGRAYPMIRIM